MVYTREGRIGDRGRIQTQGPYALREVAIKEFTKIFKKKTGNLWPNRNAFVSPPKCYTYVELDYSQIENKLAVAVSCFVFVVVIVSRRGS